MANPEDDDKDGIGGGCQKMTWLVALCRWCHAVTNMDFSFWQGAGREERALQHLVKVKNTSLAEARKLP
jgi:hypothetical protein